MFELDYAEDSEPVSEDFEAEILAALEMTWPSPDYIEAVDDAFC